MLDALNALRGGRLPARSFTTLLCCVWGYSFAFSFFRCLLYRPNLCVGMAAALPLAAVWGTLERKRWGRITLLSLSFLALALFIWMLGTLVFAQRAGIPSGDRNLAGCFDYALRLYAETPGTTIATLLLSLLTAFWFFLPFVRSEFDQGKKVVLTSGQRLIAACLVVFWCLTMLATPSSEETRSNVVPLKTTRRLTTRY